jgi:broad specificity phosphatase PhoE
VSELWIARHGETEWSRAGRHTGRTDLPLTAEGRREARALGRVLRGRRFALVLSSPLSRAWETSRLAGYADSAEPSVDLLEWDYGAIEGRTSAQVRAERPGWVIWDATAPPLGESLDEVAARARRVIARAVGAGGDVLLFSHGHLLRILTACWLGLPPRAARLFPLATASLGVLAEEADTLAPATPSPREAGLGEARLGRGLVPGSPSPREAGLGRGRALQAWNVGRPPTTIGRRPRARRRK